MQGHANIVTLFGVYDKVDPADTSKRTRYLVLERLAQGAKQYLKKVETLILMKPNTACLPAFNINIVGLCFMPCRLTFLFILEMHCVTFLFSDNGGGIMPKCLRAS